MRVQHSVVIDGTAARFGSAAPTGSLERRAGLSRAEFVAEYQNPRRPVILTDAARAWPLYKQASPGYFRARYGTHRVHVRGIAFDQLGPDNWPAFVGDVVAGDRRSKPVRTWALGAYLRAIDPLLNAAERFGVNQSTRWGMR